MSRRPPLPPLSRVEGVPPIEGLTAGHEPSPVEVKENEALEEAKAVREQMADSGSSRAEAEAWVLGMGGGR